MGVLTVPRCVVRPDMKGSAVVAAALLLQCLGVDSFLAPIKPTVRSSTLVCSAEQARGLTRGGALEKAVTYGAVVGAGLGLGGLTQSARADDSVAYKDEKYAVSFSGIPTSWQRTDTAVGSDETDKRRLVVFKDPSSESAVFVAYTPIQPDFTSLGSFGGIAAVEKIIVPKGYGVESRLIKAESRKPGYFYDYTLQPTGQPKRHLKTVFGVVPGEVLVTYTAQCLEQDYPNIEALFTAITDSVQINVRSHEAEMRRVIDALLVQFYH